MKFSKRFRNSIFEFSVESNRSFLLDWIEAVLPVSACPIDCLPPISVRFHFECEEPLSAQSLRRLQYNVVERAGLRTYEMSQPLTRVRIEKESSEVFAQVFTQCEFFQERVLSSVFFSPLRLIASWQGVFFIHAALATDKSHSVLICGPSGSGKSSLGLLLAQSGYRLFTDENAFLTLVEGKPVVFPFFTKGVFRSSVLARVPPLMTIAKKSEATGKFRIGLDIVSAGNNQIVGAVPVDVVLFPTFAAKAGVSFAPVCAEVALKHLIRESERRYIQEGMHDLALSHFISLRELVMAARSYKLQYNDEAFDELPRLIDRLSTEQSI